MLQDLIEELIGEEIEDETDASLSPQPHTTLDSAGPKPNTHRKRRGTNARQRITQQAQFLNYITERRQTKTPSAHLGSEFVFVVCSTLRAKHPDVFGPLRFDDGALEAFVQGCRVMVFDATNAASSVEFPYCIVEFERAVAEPFIVLQVCDFANFVGNNLMRILCE
jgi:hypothetical protein